MSKTAIVIDSTVNLPGELNNQLDIQVVPLNICWNDEIFADGIDLSPTAFYERLEKAKNIPTTSQPAPALFVETWKKLLDQGKDILTITISGKLSGTYDAAMQAKEMLNSGSIEVFDGNSAAMGVGLTVIEVARAAKAGANLQECLQIAEQVSSETVTRFAVDSLEFLHRGGRIGGGSRFIGTALNFKPILWMNDGAIDALERVRTSKKARARLIELMSNDLQEDTDLFVGIMHSNALEAATAFKAAIDEKFKPTEIVMADLSPVIGTHTGPGTIGLSFYAK